MASHGVEKTPSEIDKALTVLAYYGGNSLRAAAELGMSASTLRLWRSSSHRDRYLEIAEREAPRLEQIAAHQAREIILRAGDAEHGLLDLMSAQITEAQAPRPLPGDFEDEDAYKQAFITWTQRPSNKELGEIAGTLQRTTTAKGINGTKLLELTGRPTQIVEHRDPKQAAQALARRLGVALEANAQDMSTTPLLSASVSANAREATPVTASPSSPAD